MSKIHHDDYYYEERVERRNKLSIDGLLNRAQCCNNCACASVVDEGAFVECDKLGIDTLPYEVCEFFEN